MFLTRTKELIEVLSNLELLKPDIKTAFNLIKDVSKNNGIIYTFGNGGSSCCASHLYGELIGKYKEVRPLIRSSCLSSNTDLITCLANDFKFKNVFVRQIEGCDKKDIIVIFTTSGNSKNLIYGIEAALAREVPIIVFSGKGGGLINQNYKDKINQIIINSENGGLIQEIHLHLIHSLVEYLEET